MSILVFVSEFLDDEALEAARKDLPGALFNSTSGCSHLDNGWGDLRQSDARGMGDAEVQALSGAQGWGGPFP